MSNKQQIFDFGISESDSSSFIVSNCNIDAYNLVERFRGPGIALILGEEGSGKTTLLKMWCSVVGALKVHDLSEIPDDTRFIAIDDIEIIDDEEQLFYILNHCLTHNIGVLATAKFLPKFARDDLNSRLSAAIKTLIRSPDDELMKLLLKRYFAMEQTIVSEETIEFLVRRIDSRFSALWDVCASLNIESFKSMRPITKGIASQVLNLPKSS